MQQVQTSNRLVTIAAYPRKLIQLFESEWQIGPEKLLEGSRLTLEQLDRPDRLVSLVDVFVVFNNAIRLSPEPDLALRYAHLLPPGSRDQAPSRLVSAPAPAGDFERKPVSFAWALDPWAELEAPAPFVAESREYWALAEASEMQAGLSIDTTAPGALIRVSPAAGKSCSNSGAS